MTGNRKFLIPEQTRSHKSRQCDSDVHPAKLKPLGRHKSFDVPGEYLEYGDLSEGHPLSDVL